MSSRQAERHGAAHASRSSPASQGRRIIASKLATPPRRPGIVDRPLLLDGLVSAAHAPVVLVSAPAGYGKTTLLATDLSLPEIARELYLSTNTVKTHTRSIYRKLGVSSRGEAVKAAGTEARASAAPHPGEHPG